MDKSTPNERWRGDSASTSSGRLSENVIDHEKFAEGARDNSELTLMRLRRLSIGLMSKNERLRYSGRRLCRSNVFQFLSSHLAHPSEKVRYLTLEVLCFTVVRLGTKTDSLLKPIMPRVIQCLRENEEKDIKRKSLHFLRVYFRHTKSLSDFIDDFVQIGLENKDPDIRNACFYGLNIIFDQDIGNSFFSLLVVSVVNHISDENINIAAYRALKYIHQTVGDDRFFDLMTLADSESVGVYMNIYDYEQSDALLSMEGNNCTSVVSTYIMKRNHMGFKKDFGILSRSFLNHVLETRNCERAKAVGYFTAALKETLWTDADLEPQLEDFLKLINSFIENSNRLVQMCGFNILKETISRMGFILSPHIRMIVKMLRHTLTSANSKIKSKTENILNKLMRNIHVMTVMWELLNTEEPSEKESVLILLQDKIKQFPYHELDMIPLCNFLGQSLEDKNSSVAKHSRTCISQLLDIMRECPIYGNRSEALKVLLRNYHLSRETLIDIDALELCGEDHLEGSESCSDHETIEEEIESEFLENSELNETEEVFNSGHDYITRRDPHSSRFRNALRPETGKSRWNYFVTPEQLENFNRSKFSGKSNQDFLTNFQIKRLFSGKDAMSLEYCCNQNCDSSIDSRLTVLEKTGIPPDPNSRNRQKTRFCMKADPVDVHREDFQDVMARGDDTEGILSSVELSITKDNTDDEQARLVSESYEQDGIHVDVMRKDIFNFNIMQVEHHQNTDGIEEVDSDYQEYKQSIPSTPLYNSEASSALIDVTVSMPEINSSPASAISPPGSTDNIEPSTPISNTDTFTISCKSLANLIPLISSNNKSNLTIDSNIKSEILSSEISAESSAEFVPKNLEIKFCNQQHSDVLLFNEKKQTQITIERETESSFEVDDRDACDTEIEHSSGNLIHYNIINDYMTEDNQHSNIALKQSDPEFSEIGSTSSCNKFDDTETPFLPKSRQLPRTPVEKKPDYSLEAPSKVSKNSKRLSETNKRNKARDQVRNKVDDNGCDNVPEESAKLPSHQGNIGPKQSEIEVLLRQSINSKHNSPSNWGGCQWRRDLDYAAKATTCSWTDQFEEMVKFIEPFPSPDAAENEMKKAVDDLFNGTWTVKEDAMLKVIRLAKHHQMLVSENTTKIALALSNEIKNFRQSVAGKAILTAGHLYEMMGKQFENKLRMVVAALLAKSGTRTLAAYYRLVVQSLVKIAVATSPQKAALAFIQEGTRQANKAARETAAQFLCVLTEHLGTDNSMVPALSSHMLKCAAMFVFDSSALTRYCGKRMFQIFMKHPDFEKLKDHHLEVNTVQNVDKILDQLRTKGVKNEILPIHLIE